MRLIVISSPANLNNEHEILCSMFEAGLEYYHLRKPDLSKEELEGFIKQTPSEYLNRIVLHSHHELVGKYNLKGKHLSSKTIEFNDNKKYISTSFHSVKEIENCKEKYNYVFLSPIFNSISKVDYKSNFDLQKLKHAALLQRGLGVEVIALGGIDEDKINIIAELGFSGVGVLGALWTNNNPTEKFKRLLKICNAHSSMESKNYA